MAGQMGKTFYSPKYLLLKLDLAIFNQKINIFTFKGKQIFAIDFGNVDFGLLCFILFICKLRHCACQGLQSFGLSGKVDFLSTCETKAACKFSKKCRRSL